MIKKKVETENTHIFKTSQYPNRISEMEHPLNIRKT